MHASRRILVVKLASLGDLLTVTPALRALRATLPDAHIGVLIADASGHGIPAAMVAIMAWLAFSESSRLTAKPGEVLTAMNNRLLGLADERYVTAFYGVFNRRTCLFKPSPQRPSGVTATA